MTTTWQYTTIKRSPQGNWGSSTTDDPDLRIALNQVGVTEHKALALAGSAGWELAAAVPGADAPTFYMKRPSD
jgi:hypothetical protein